MKREELKAYNVYSTRGDGAYGFCKEADPTDVELEKVDVYIAPEADEVMDAMEARIKEIVKALENAVAGGEIIKGLCERHEVRIKELEAENSRLKSIVGDEEYTEGLAGLAQRNVELREENERLKKEVFDYHQLQWRHDALIDENEKLEAANFDLQSHFDVLKEDYDAVVSKLEKAQPKWISVKDRLPDIGDIVLVYFDERVKSHYFPIDVVRWDSSYELQEISVTHWMPLPPPPTTEESSATEKENG